MEISEGQNQKQIVLKKWDELIQELSICLEQTKKQGGTGGYKVGSLRDKQIKLKELFQTL